VQSFCCRVDGVERVLCEMFLQMCDCLCATKRALIWMLLSIGVDLISGVVCRSVLQFYSVLWCVAVCQYRDWFVWSGVLPCVAVLQCVAVCVSIVIRLSGVVLLATLNCAVVFTVVPACYTLG